MWTAEEGDSRLGAQQKVEGVRLKAIKAPGQGLQQYIAFQRISKMAGITKLIVINNELISMCTLRLPWKQEASWNIQGIRTSELVSQLGVSFIQKRFLLGVSISRKDLFIKWQGGRHSPQSDPMKLLKLWTYFKILQVQINQGAIPGPSLLSTHTSGPVLLLPETGASVITLQKYELSGPACFPLYANTRVPHPPFPHVCAFSFFFSPWFYFHRHVHCQKCVQSQFANILAFVRK